MKSAVIREPGRAPQYLDFAEPVAEKGEVLITVKAAALSQLTRSRAAGTHYSSTARYPFVAGVDGVGQLDNGRRIYFVLPRNPYGAMAERSVAPSENCLPLPDDLDNETAAAIANPGMSAWAALKERARLETGETVLINGATGVSGQLAIQIAKYLGAKKIIATGRNPDRLKALEQLGADVTIPLAGNDDAREHAFKQAFAQGVDIVLDYLWGHSARQLLIAAAKATEDGRAVRFVQIGSMTGEEISLPAKVLRSSAIELMGSGFGSITAGRLLKAIGELLQAVIPGGFQIAVRRLPLAEVESAWNQNDSGRRTVFTP